MKKIFSLIVLAALLLFPLHLEAASNGYGATALTGGTTGCLDAINGALLNDGDKAFVLTATQFYFYTLDANSGAAESSPDIISPDTNAGNKRWTQVSSHSIFGLSSLTQGDLPYTSAANTLSALAIGTANYKLFSNAGATAPEWASGLKLMSITRDMTAASGDVSTTGVGFKPGALVAFACSPGTEIESKGLAVGTTNFCIAKYTANTVTASGTLIVLSESWGITEQSAIAKSMDADGFTLTWTKVGVTGAATANIYVLCIR